MEKFGFTGKMPGVADALMFEDMFIDGDDFVTQLVTAEDYAETNATAGTADIDPAGDNGVLLLDSNSATVTQGIQIQRPAANFVPKAGRTIFFEARVKVADTFDEAQLFIGLGNIETAIIASSTVATTSHIAFTTVTDDGILLSNIEKAGVGDTGTGTTIAEDTWVTLGFKVNGLTDVTFYVNGAAVYKNTTTTAIPNVALSPSFVCQSGAGATDPIMHLDYWKCAQTR